jgi:hypothetical protein
MVHGAERSVAPRNGKAAAVNVPRLALRALNEYRRVSPFTYLALRYTLRSTAAQNDRWAKELAPEILARRDGPAYLPCWQYKQINKRGSFEYRDLHFPCANEALAEAALLAHCAEAGGPFAPADDVFSYHLASPTSGEGNFKAYFKLFSARQNAIGKACRQRPNDIVLYADVKAFYPSVPQGRARAAWSGACTKAGIQAEWHALGLRLMEEQRAIMRSDTKRIVRNGLLVGPMFSHVLGNLVLLEFDAKMRAKYSQRYFRYVDDIALVIPRQEKDAALRFIREQLKRIGLRLNRKKICELSTREWKAAAPHQVLDYDGVIHRIDDEAWMRFIDQVKCFLILNPQHSGGLARTLRDAGIRIPIPHYTSSVQDAGYVSRFTRRLLSNRFQQKLAGISIHSIVGEAKTLGVLYRKEFNQVWQEFSAADSMKRKWLLSRIRYVLGRLVLVAPEDQLGALAKELEAQEELAEYEAIFRSLETQDVSELLRYSGKVNAGAGQALATTGKPVKCAPKRWSREAIEGYVTLLLLGVNLDVEPPTAVRRQTLVRFTEGQHEKHDWVKTSNGFLQELLALSGESSLQRHRSLFQEPIDPDERWVLFADELRGISS